MPGPGHEWLTVNCECMHVHVGVPAQCSGLPVACMHTLTARLHSIYTHHLQALDHHLVIMCIGGKLNALMSIMPRKQLCPAAGSYSGQLDTSDGPVPCVMLSSMLHTYTAPSRIFSDNTILIVLLYSISDILCRSCMSTLFTIRVNVRPPC